MAKSNRAWWFYEDKELPKETWPAEPAPIKYPVWVRCKLCEKFYCNIHKIHVSDCACPPLEEWTTDPYTGQPGPASKK